MIARGFGGPGSNPILLIALALLVISFFSGTMFGPLRSLQTDPNAFFGFIFAIVVGITVHEFMHAYTAHRLGDDTARLLGRMSLNPVVHFDIFGTLLLVLAGFGYGKPVPVNESRLRGAFASSMVSFAGPLANFAIAAVCAIPLRLGTTDVLGPNYTEILEYMVLFNCVLGIFNLIPIPPLDGAGVVLGLLPPKQQYDLRPYMQYGPILLLLLLWFGGRILQTVVFAPAQTIARLLIGV
ncbi:MAG TPA: site-2 protease family protein [Candidatus Limnocylindria bacterium]|nr:site-2 protease family protein [Candidatus Limnocylindria bacterium]